VLIIEYVKLDKGKYQMPNDISVDAILGFIEVRSYGDLSKEDVLDTIARVAQTSAQSGIDKILEDTSGLMNAPGFVDLFDISANFPRKYKHALLMRRTQPTAERVAFFETVGRNRGHRVRLFTDREAALQWLQDP